MKKSGKKLCGTALALAVCAISYFALVSCGLFGGETTNGEKYTVTFDAGWGTVFGDRFYKTDIIPTSVTRIDHWAFKNCPTNLVVYYGGDASGWSAVSIDKSGNDAISGSVTKYYYSETSQIGYWHFGNDGKPVLW